MKEVVQHVCDDLEVTRNEAELIIATLLDRPRFELYMKQDIDARTHTLLTMKLKQLKKGVPLEYITQRIHFRDLVLTIRPGVFIPRLETEYFVELIEKLLDFSPLTILDIGTGTGALAIALAMLFPNASVAATDISDHALTCARHNVKHYNLAQRVHVVKQDIFAGLTTTYDLIVSNPPYIPRARFLTLPKSVKDFEPRRALDGGKEGIEFITHLLKNGLHHLNPNGAMALEIDETQVRLLQKLLHATVSKPYCFKKDLSGRYRYLFIGNCIYE